VFAYGTLVRTKIEGYEGRGGATSLQTSEHRVTIGEACAGVAQDRSRMHSNRLVDSFAARTRADAFEAFSPKAR
jgi:hypothetical protein